MIEKMTRYDFILLDAEKDGFLNELKAIGIVDVKRSTKPVDERSLAIMDEIEASKAEIKTIKSGSDEHLLEMGADLEELKKKSYDAKAWGKFDRSDIDKLEESGIKLSFYRCEEKKFNPSWEEDFAIQVIAKSGKTIWFVVINPNGFPLKAVEAPEMPYSAYDSKIKELQKEYDDYREKLGGRMSEIPDIEAKIKAKSDELNLYLAGIGAETAVENSIAVFEAYAPSKDDGLLKDKFDDMDIFYTSAPASVEDCPPIEFRNNWFVRMFEPLTDMYGRPAYNGFDPTPFISIFFLLFFAMCMGDAGYGIVLVIAGILLKKVKSFSSLAPLVVTLGIGTIVIGFFFHTFFSMDISHWEFIRNIGLDRVMVPAKLAGYDGTMILALLVGIVHLCLAMLVKLANTIKNNGFLNSLGVCGWTLLIVGGVVVAAIALAGVIDAALTKLIVIVLGIVSAIGIFPLNNINRNPLINIGSGLWETYNTATGILGDVLSYLRLYALGLAGGMLGFAFNDLAGMALGDGGVRWIFFILIVIIGHTLNLAMAALGAFVHPLRLNFLEFFKNSGYEAAGKKYNPLK